ncbi:zinc finger CCCH domain-containing protein 14-like [Coffea eugenioides]|uniref:Zinc finger CCCH domain-containing protein 14-like n=1 Tax=Coffea arabica TaxID=13443 RepID=A0ABM4WWX6_COFAR|nr:zinc finger CCCH domain-containing protein 14-like [Coffea eugenioides]
MEFGGRKRERPDGAFTGNGGYKKSRDELESFTTGVGSKSKPCMKFFSTSGCQFGEGCHFLHYVPGYSAHSQLANLGATPAVPGGRNVPFSDGPTLTVKTKLCTKFNTPEGCRFGDKCHFAHGDMELGKSLAPGYQDPRSMGPMGRLSGHFEPSPPGLGAAASFGTSATAKISIDASLAGAIIGKNGVNSKHICRATGVKLSIKDHETDSNQRNIELEGSFDQIKQASGMVRELIANIGGPTSRTSNTSGSFGRGVPPARQYKSKMCENFPKGSCTFGDRCHFAHSASELRKPPT